MGTKFKPTKIIYNETYYSMKLLESVPGFSEKIQELYKYYQDNGCSIPEEGFDNLPRSAYNKWVSDIAFKNLVPYKKKFNQLVANYITESTEDIETGLIYKYIWKTEAVPAETLYKVTHTEGDDPHINLRLNPGITKEDYDEAWKRIQVDITKNSIYKTRNVEWHQFDRDMKIYKLYRNLNYNDAEFNEKNWEDKLRHMQRTTNDKEKLSALYGFRIDPWVLRDIVSKCEEFFIKYPHINKDILLTISERI